MPGPSVASIVRTARLRNDLTLEALAERSGITDRAIGDIERGVRPSPRLHTLRALAHALELADPEREELLAAARAARSARLGEQPTGALPHRLPDFVGREEETAALRRLLAAGHEGAPAVVVISGAPGTGKTTIAAELLHETGAGTDRLSVDLRGLDARPVEPVTILRQLLAQLPGAPEPAGALAALAEQWRAATAGRTVLVLLDNAATEAQVRPVLGFAGTGGVVVTSRRRLAGLEGAKHLAVGPLSTEASIDLLTAILPETTAGAQELTALVELCDRVPLALRIAGSRLASNPSWRITDFLDELRSEERRLRALVAGDLAVESAFGLSYEQVTDEARRLFRVLSLIDDATWPDRLPGAILGTSWSATQEGLDELVELGLVQQIAPTRYRLHDLMRLFSRGKLTMEVAPSAVDALERRKRDWLIRSAIAAGSWFEPDRDSAAGPGGFGDEAEARAWLQSEVGSWLPALRAIAADGQDRAVLELADSLHWFSDIWAHAGIWAEVYDLSSSVALRMDDAREQAIHLGYLSWAELAERRDLAASLAAARASLESAQRAGDPDVEGWSWAYIATTQVDAAQWDEVVEATGHAARLFETTGNREGLPTVLVTRANANIANGRFADAEADMRRLIRFVRDPATAPVRNIALLADSIAQVILSKVLRLQGDLQGALRAGVDASAAAEAVGHERAIARALQVRGHALSLLGRPRAAQELLEDAQRRFIAVGRLDEAAEAAALLEGLADP